jgi:large subunit ribosomal protein L32
MAVPKKRQTKSRRGMRRSHDHVGRASFAECANCGEMKRPHHLCPACGYYDGREVVARAAEAS